MKVLFNYRVIIVNVILTLFYCTNLRAQNSKSNTIDTIPPSITFTPLYNSNASNRTLNNFATITDNESVSNSIKPRLYYKKKTDADAFIGNTSADNGWKYVVANNNTSPYSFTINYSLIYGGSVANGNEIEYFVVAQDASNNLNSYPTGAVASTNPPVENISAKPSSIYSYKIYTSTIGGNVNVGVGQTYTSLTGAGGLFEAINSKIVTNDINAIITSDLNEDGTNALNQFSESPENAMYYLTILPSNNSMKIISGTNVPIGTPMININGVYYVEIRGTTGFRGPYLTFRNTNTDSSKIGPVIQFNNGCTEAYLYKCIIESNASNPNIGSLTVGNSGTNNVHISECDIRNVLNGNFNQPTNAIYSNSSTNSIIVDYSNIYNFNSYGILFKNVANECLIENNSIYATEYQNNSQTCISIQNGNGHTIYNNFIGGSVPDGDGNWINNGFASTFKGISTAGSTITPNSIQNNSIWGVNLTGTGKNSFVGIEVSSGMANIGTDVYNRIGNSFSPIIVEGDSNTTGILISSNDYVNISSNRINNIYATGTGTNVSLKGIHYCGTGSPLISSNLITDMVSYGNSPDHDSSVSVCGILSNNKSLFPTITENTIRELGALGSTGRTLCMGIAVNTINNLNTPIPTNTIAKNAIYRLYNTSSDPLCGINGIYLFNANIATQGYPAISKVYNNMISLDNLTNTNGVNIRGIYTKNNFFQNDSILFNSVYIGGESNDNSNSYCFERTNKVQTTLKNNIFVNKRSSTSGKRYSLANTYSNPSDGWSAQKIDYNLFYSSNPATTVYWNGDKTFASYKSTSSSDTNSSNVDVSFQYAEYGDLHLAGSSLYDLNLKGVYINNITDDIDWDSRPILPGPYMGADEAISNPLPIELLSFKGIAETNANSLSWETANEINFDHFEIEKLTSEKNFSTIGQVTTSGNNHEYNRYHFIDNNISKENQVEYYRLRMVDKNNINKYSDVIAIKRNAKTESFVSIYPNPTTDVLTIWISDPDETRLSLVVYDLMGKVVAEKDNLLYNQTNNISLEQLPLGLYTIKINGLIENNIWKISKK